MKRLKITICSLLLIFPVLASASKTTLRLAYGQSESDPIHGIFAQVAKNIHAQTNGDITIQQFPSGQLGSERDMHEQVKLGSPIMTLVDPGYMAAYAGNDFSIFAAPFAFKSVEEVKRALQSEPVKKLFDNAEKSGIKVLAHNMFPGDRNIVAKAPHPHPDSLKGVKFRLPPIAIYMDSFSALGVTPVTVDFAESYGALQQGIVEATEATLLVTDSFKLYEVAPNVITTGHIKQTWGIMMSKAVFDKLKPEYQEILLEEFNKGGEVINEMSKIQQEKLVVELTARGVKFIEPDVDSYAKLVEPMYENYDKWSPGFYKEIRSIVEAD